MSSEIVLTIRFEHYSEPSRMRGAWYIHVQSASHLPASDGPLGKSDPFAVVTVSEERVAEDKKAFSSRGSLLPTSMRRAQGRTDVKTDTLDPVWNEELEFPVARSDSVHSL